APPVRRGWGPRSSLPRSCGRVDSSHPRVLERIHHGCSCCCCFCLLAARCLLRAATLRACRVPTVANPPARRFSVRAITSPTAGEETRAIPFASTGLLNCAGFLSAGGAADAKNAAIAVLRFVAAACSGVFLGAVHALVAQIADHVERAVL